MSTDTIRIDWRPPAAPADPLFGSGATRTERALALGAGAVGTAIVIGAALVTVGDRWWVIHYVLVALVALDVLGGVVANALNSAKRDHHGPPADPSARAGRIARSPVAFSALHVQPIVLAIAVPPHAWWWGLLWYVVVLLAVVVVVNVPQYLARPVSYAVAMLAVVSLPVVPAPEGLEWLPLALVLKLVMAHAVREEPYRPQVRA